MKKLLLLLLFLSSFGFAQGKYKLLTTIETEADYFTTDNQCNVYVVKGNEIIKYDKAGKQLCKYSNKNFGNITFVDASNMLRILLYYKDFQQVVFLDNTLSQNGEPVSLAYLDISNSPMVCSSYNNGMWVYDQQNFSLIRYDKTLQDIQQTSNLNTLLNDSIQPNEMIEYNNRLYLNDPRTGIMIFDIYGTYYKTVPVKNTSAFQPVGEWIYYVIDKKVKAFQIKTTEEKEFEMPADFKRFRLETGILVLQDDKSITLYSAE